LQAIAGGALQGRDLDERQGARDQFDFKRAVEVLRLMSDRCGARSPAAATSSRRQ